MEIRFVRDPNSEDITSIAKWGSTTQRVLDAIRSTTPVELKHLASVTGYRLSTLRTQVGMLKRIGLIETASADASETSPALPMPGGTLIEKAPSSNMTGSSIALTEIPSMARNDSEASNLLRKQALLPTKHRLYLGDSRSMVEVEDDSVHLVLTSPPYWVLKPYRAIEGQLGVIQDYQEFLDELTKVMKECYRVLTPGGRFICVVGDVCLSRRKAGRHVVYPLHSDITVRARAIGFDNLTPILWYKIASARYEANTYSTILGKPYEPNAVIKNDVEFILIQRKPGAYRKPTTDQRKTSFIPRKFYEQWFRQIWNITGASTREHPAPFPLELALRLVRMYSFTGDTVLDPFVGTGTTMTAALKSGRNSIGYEIDQEYADVARKKLRAQSSNLLGNSQIFFAEKGIKEARTDQ